MGWVFKRQFPEEEALEAPYISTWRQIFKSLVIRGTCSNDNKILLCPYETGKHQEGSEYQLLVGGAVPGSLRRGGWRKLWVHHLKKCSVAAEPAVCSWFFSPEIHLQVWRDSTNDMSGIICKIMGSWWQSGVSIAGRVKRKCGWIFFLLVILVKLCLFVNIYLFSLFIWLWQVLVGACRI